MKIGINAISGNMCSGAKTYLINLLPRLSRLRPDWEFILWYNIKDEFIHQAIPSRITAHPVSSSIVDHPIKRLFFEQITLVRWMRQEKVDALFSAISGTSFLASMLMPTVGIIHQSAVELYHLQPRPRMIDFLRLGYLYLTTRFVSRMIAISDTSVESVAKGFHLPRSKFITIYHGGAGADFGPGVGKTSETNPHANGAVPYILSVSTIYRYKNFANLIRAYSCLVAEHNIPHSLILAGGIADEQYYRELQELVHAEMLDDRVIFLQQVPYDQLAALYSNASIYVNPSIVESFGITQIEAMACGTPVCASNTSVMPEVCGNAALYFDPNHPADMARAMLLLLNDEDLYVQMQEKALERAAFFNWDVTTTHTLQLFESLFFA